MLREFKIFIVGPRVAQLRVECDFTAPEIVLQQFLADLLVNQKELRAKAQSVGHRGSVSEDVMSPRLSAGHFRTP